MHPGEIAFWRVVAPPGGACFFMGAGVGAAELAKEKGKDCCCCCSYSCWTRFDLNTKS